MKSIFQRVVPVFPARDVGAAIAFYQSLGFALRFQVEDYAGVVRDEIELHLWKCDDPNIAHNTGCRIAVENLDAIHDELRQLNVIHPNGALHETDWNTREFSILDADGSILTFFEAVKSNT